MKGSRMITVSPTIRSRRQATYADRKRDRVDLQPSSTYEAITRQMVEDLGEDLREIKSRINNIFYIVVGSILVDMLTRWMGG
jgi:hypothetical protein